MKLTYDKRSGAAYLRIDHSTGKVKTHDCNFKGANIYIDIDTKTNKIVGIEFVEASNVLSKKTLKDVTNSIEYETEVLEALKYMVEVSPCQNRCKKVI